VPTASPTGDEPAVPISGAELSLRLRGVEAAVVFATALEAEPLLDHLDRPVRLDVATKAWWLGTLTAGGEAVPTAVLTSGCDQANMAHALTCLLQAATPRLVILAGVAGAFPGGGVAVGDLVLATEEVYAASGVEAPHEWLDLKRLGLPVAEVAGCVYHNVLPLDADLVAAAARVLEGWSWPSGEEWSWPDGRPRVSRGRCLTLSQVTGRQQDGRRLQDRWGGVAESMEGAAAVHMCLLYGVPFLEVRGISNLVGDRDRASWNIPVAAARAAEAARALVAALPRLPGVGGWR